MKFGHSTLLVEYKQRKFEKIVPEKYLDLRQVKWQERWIANEKYYDQITEGEWNWTRHVSRMKIENTYNCIVGKPERTVEIRCSPNDVKSNLK
jgi:hypothetical protein